MFLTNNVQFHMDIVALNYLTPHFEKPINIMIIQSRDKSIFYILSDNIQS